MTTIPPKQILLVDDHPLFLEVTQQILQDAGYIVDAVNNGKEALASIENNLPHLLITDLFMPEMDGIELIRTLRNRGYNLPILATTGIEPENGMTYLKMAHLLGAKIQLPKPVQKDKLLESVASLLGITKLEIES